MSTFVAESATHSATQERPWILTGGFWLRAVLWIYLLANIPHATWIPVITARIVQDDRNLAAAYRSRSETEEASVKEAEADGIHYDQTQNTNAAWIGLGAALVGLAVIYRR